MDVAELFRGAVSKYLGFGAKVGGSALLGPAWPFVEPAVEAVLKVLDERMGTAFRTSEERLEKAVAAFDQDEHLSSIFVGSLQQQLAPVLEGQARIRQDIEDSVWQLASIVSRMRASVSEEIEKIRVDIDKGVRVAELQPQALQQLAALVRELVEEANTVKEIAGACQSLVLAEGRSHAQRLQVRAASTLDRGDVQDAWDDVQASALITSILLQQAPADIALRLQLGMVFKTTAQILEASGETDRAQAALADAERLFELVRTEVPSGGKTVLDLANAVHGKGDIYAQRGQPDSAIKEYRLALQLEPDHVFALYGIFAALTAKAQAGDLDIDGMAAALCALQAKVAELEARNGRKPIPAHRLQALEQALDYWRSKQAGAAPDDPRV